MNNIEHNITSIVQALTKLEEQNQRPTKSVRLLAVSKGQALTKLEQAQAAGINAFAENYLREALVKISALRGMDVEWHFIGQLQSNKTRALAENFAWVQTLTNKKHAQRLNDQRPSELPRLNVCIQVHIGEQEDNKGGIAVSEIVPLLEKVTQLPRLHCRGLMAIAPQSRDEQEQYDMFMSVKHAFDDLCQQGYQLDTLSLGMSHDYAAAIAAGSTMVRIGSALFGERQ